MMSFTNGPDIVVFSHWFSFFKLDLSLLHINRRDNEHVDQASINTIKSLRLAKIFLLSHSRLLHANKLSESQNVSCFD